MPRKVVRHRPALCALIAALALTAPAAASGETVSVTPESDPVAGQSNGVGYEYDTGGVQLSLTIIVRPSAGPPCSATPTTDAATVGASGGSTYVTPAPIQVTGRGLGRVPFTYPSAGSWRICGWLARTADDVAATAVNQVDVRLPRGNVTVTASQDAPKAGGSGLTVHVTGGTEAAADVLVTAVGASSQCPPTYDEATDPLAFDVVPAGVPTRVTGAFDLQFAARDLLSYRAWRVCAFVQDGATAASASVTGSTIIDLLLRPQLLRRPRVKQKGSVLTCDGGRWKARPGAKTTYAWLAGGRRIAGATHRRLTVAAKLRGASVSCRVSATNTLGTATATSRAVHAR